MTKYVEYITTYKFGSIERFRAKLVKLPNSNIYIGNKQEEHMSTIMTEIEEASMQDVDMESVENRTEAPMREKEEERGNIQDEISQSMVDEPPRENGAENDNNQESNIKETPEEKKTAEIDYSSWSAEELKSEGNKCMGRRFYMKSVEMYSKALKKEPSHLTARMNRALAYIQRHQWWGALSDIYTALNLLQGGKLHPDPVVEDTMDPVVDPLVDPVVDPMVNLMVDSMEPPNMHNLYSNIQYQKLIYRKAQTLNGLRAHKEASKELEKVIPHLPLTPPDTISNYNSLLALTQGYIESGERGIYNFHNIFEQCYEENYVMAAEYIGDIRVQNYKDLMYRGRRVIAHRPFTHGELLCVSKALGMDYMDDELTANCRFDKRKKMNYGFCFWRELERNVLNEVENINCVHYDLLYTLDDGGESLPQVDIDYVREHYNKVHERDEYSVDIMNDRIRNIVKLNYIETKNMLNEQGDNEVSHFGLWIVPSYFRHSCLPNTTHFVVDDVIFIRAGRDIQEGEEIFLQKVSIDPEFQSLEVKMDERKIQCGCKRCVLAGKVGQTGRNLEKIIKIVCKLTADEKAENLNEEETLDIFMKNYNYLEHEMTLLERNLGVDYKYALLDIPAQAYLGLAVLGMFGHICPDIAMKCYIRALDLQPDLFNRFHYSRLFYRGILEGYSRTSNYAQRAMEDLRDSFIKLFGKEALSALHIIINPITK